MNIISVYINDVEVKATKGSSILEEARRYNIYIPSLCYHPDLPPPSKAKATTKIYRGDEEVVGDESEKEFEGCNLCLVEVDGQPDLVRACDTPVIDGMRVYIDTERVLEARREKLMLILAKHPHACLICAQKEGCTREPCPTKVPVAERCCPKLGNCELERVAEYIGIREDTPRFIPANLLVVRDEPLFTRDHNLCIGCTRCVRACQELRGVKALGFVPRNGEVFVGTVAPTLKESACKFCGACVEVCPTGALMDKEIIVGEREESLIPCKSACPIGIDVPQYTYLIAQGRHAEAAAVVREKAPLPSVLGHACARPCESECRRGQVDEAISICALKRFAMEQDKEIWRARVKVNTPTGKRVAIIGSGPAGLTAAFYLAKLGHSITIFESMPELGGMMRYGIQEFRLPREVLQKDLEEIVKLSVEVNATTPIKESLNIDHLKNEGYDAILVATGLQESNILKVDGFNLKGVLGGLDFLRDHRLGKDVNVGERVLVVGGGNVAMDVSLTALRLGAKQVQVACLEAREEMPAFTWEVQQALEEGIAIYNSWGIKKILGDGEKVAGAELIHCVSVFDQEGRFNPSLDESVTRTLNADMIIFAIGQLSDLSWLTPSSIQVTQLGTIKVVDYTETGVQGVFACGDIVTGPASIVEAMDSAKKAVLAIDKYLGGIGKIDEELTTPEKPSQWLGREEDFPSKRRVEMPSLPIEKRRGNFIEVEQGFDEEMAVDEARRCLRCDLRLQISQPTLPPEKWLKFEAENVENVPETEGVYQLLDDNKLVVFIKGTINLRKELEEQLATNPKVSYFLFEEARMFTMRESELLQRFLKRYGKLPEQNMGLEEDLY